MADPDFRRISFADLVCDPANPRLPGGTSVTTDRDAVRALFAATRPQFIKLAEDISNLGVSPFMPLYVRKWDANPKRYLVLEGNRRVAAVKTLHAPEIIDDLLTAAERKRLNAASRGSNVPTELWCAVTEESPAEVREWLARRHKGQMGGIGLVGWGPLQIDRDNKRAGRPTPTLDILERVAALRPDGIPEHKLDKYSNLQRIGKSQHARRFLGTDRDKVTGELVFLGPEEEVLRAWGRMVDEVVGGLSVTRIENTTDQVKFINGFGVDVLPDAAKMHEVYRTAVLPKVEEILGERPANAPAPESSGDNSGDGNADNGGSGNGGGGSANNGGSGNGGGGNADNGGSGNGGSGGGTGTAARPKNRLIPQSPRLGVRPTRVAAVYTQLQRMPVGTYPDAVAVMFRVFLELSVNTLYLEESARPGGWTGWTPNKKEKEWRRVTLRRRVRFAIDWLQKEGHLQGSSALAAKKVLDSENMTDAHVTVLNQYVHNEEVFVDGKALMRAWDGMQSFFVALWNTRPKPPPEAQGGSDSPSDSPSDGA